MPLLSPVLQALVVLDYDLDLSFCLEIPTSRCCLYLAYHQGRQVGLRIKLSSDRPDRSNFQSRQAPFEPHLLYWFFDLELLASVVGLAGCKMSRHDCDYGYDEVYRSD